MLKSKDRCENSTSLNQQFLEAKSIVLDRDIAEEKRWIMREKLMVKLNNLRHRGILKLQVNVDLSLLNDEIRKLYEVDIMKEELSKTEFQELCEDTKHLLFEHFFTYQLSLLQDKNHPRITFIVPTPNVVHLQNGALHTQPYEAERSWVYKDNYQSIDLELNPVWEGCLIVLKPHYYPPFNGSGPFIPYQIPLELVTSIREADSGASITPSVHKHTLKLYTEP